MVQLSSNNLKRYQESGSDPVTHSVRITAELAKDKKNTGSRQKQNMKAKF
jgi:hypothetical protein